jgi:hypothetical protein
MIKELALEHKKIALLCNSRQEFRKIVNIATSEINFSKSVGSSVRFETKYDILREYLGKIRSKSMYLLICVNDLQKSEYCPRIEFEFYIRDFQDHDLYTDWEEIKIIEYTKELRRQKIQKILE